MRKQLVYGVGINDLPGWSSSSNPKRRWIYREWKSMLQRCYSSVWHQKYPTYVDCIVCERWLRFSNFVADFTKIPGFEIVEQFGFKGVSLDKDSRVIGNKEYGPDYCTWMSRSDNAREAVIRNGASLLNSDSARKNGEAQGKPVVAISPDGEITEYYGTREVARQIGFNMVSVLNCCKTSYGSHMVKKGNFKGWSFYWKEDYDATYLRRALQ